jgi:hypothetical protein
MQDACIKLWRTTLDPTKPGRGILASLEHNGTEAPPRRSAIAAPASARGVTLVVAGGVLAGALLAWWLSSGPSPVIVHEALPPFVLAVPATPEPVTVTEAAAIVDEAAAPAPAPAPASSPVAAPGLVAVAPPAPIAKAVLRHDRVPVARPHATPAAGPKQVAAVHEQARRAPRVAPPAAVPDTDVVLLSALVAHANERDVVEPRPGDSTASLLQRCRRVGGEEGRLCHARICSGRAADEVCREDL